MLENCNYVIELAKEMDFVIVGMQGNDIRQGSRNLVLGLVWQIMRAYTLNLLKKLSSDGTPISETEILSWANKKLMNPGKHTRHKQMQVKSFQVFKIHKIRVEFLPHI